jgi:glyoxylase-like metal-dependent hydrolase (beta-lactamase superfamily II)
MTIKTFQTGVLQTNSYLIWDDGGESAVIDAGDFSEELYETITAKKLTAKYLILTHGHGDHIGGVQKYKEKFPQIKICAGEKEKEIIQYPENNYTKDIFRDGFVVEPDIYLKEGDELFLGKTKMEILETPGHTPGGISIFVPDANPAVFAGDELFWESVGRADLYGGNWDVLVKAVQEKLYKLPPQTIVYPGHGPSTTIENELKNNPFVRPNFNDPYAEEVNKEVT